MESLSQGQPRMLDFHHDLFLLVSHHGLNVVSLHPSIITKRVNLHHGEEETS